MVSEQVRVVEREIDESIRQLPIWKCKKNLLLKALMDFWRDGLEVAYTRFVHSSMFQSSESLKAAIAMEHQIHAGVFWCLKWAFEYACSSPAHGPTDDQTVRTVMEVGAPYQVLVDALKFETVGGYDLDVDGEKQTLTIYEGGDVSGYDQKIISQDHASLPFHKQTPLISDSDQLTTRWTAGAYREYWKGLAKRAEEAEEKIVAQCGPLSTTQTGFNRPVVLEIPAAAADLQFVQEDLTLTQQKIDGGLKWKLAEWQDCPLVQIDSHTFGVSSVIRTLSTLDDCMLRIAALNDRKQYEKVSGLREERMVEACRAAFQNAGWCFQPHVRLKDPPREIDGHAVKNQQDVIVELKSTLRPLSPWEVHKRNSDVIRGIDHTAEVLSRFRDGAVGFVITDGYEGDYLTWVESLRTRVAVATLRDVTLIASDPNGAFQMLAERAGIIGKASSEPLPERIVELCGWTIRVVDAPKPA